MSKLVLFQDCSSHFSPTSQVLAFNEVNLSKPKYIWSDCLFISLTTYLTVFYIFYFVRINYDKRMSKNKCTLAPFLFNTVSLIALNLKFIVDPFFEWQCVLADRIFEYCTGSTACVFYLCAVCVQIYEWDIVSHQIGF